MATRVSIVIDQGSTFTSTISLNDQNDNPLNVTGMIANAEMRKTYYSVNAVSFSTNLSNGFLTLSLSAAQTASIEDGKYVYDVILTDNSGNVTRLIEGLVTVNPSVTRS